MGVLEVLGKAAKGQLPAAPFPAQLKAEMEEPKFVNTMAFNPKTPLNKGSQIGNNSEKTYEHARKWLINHAKITHNPYVEAIPETIANMVIPHTIEAIPLSLLMTVFPEGKIGEGGMAALKFLPAGLREQVYKLAVRGAWFGGLNAAGQTVANVHNNEPLTKNVALSAAIGAALPSALEGVARTYPYLTKPVKKLMSMGTDKLMKTPLGDDIIEHLVNPSKQAVSIFGNLGADVANELKKHLNYEYFTGVMAETNSKDAIKAINENADAFIKMGKYVASAHSIDPQSLTPEYLKNLGFVASVENGALNKGRPEFIAEMQNNNIPEHISADIYDKMQSVRNIYDKPFLKTAEDLHNKNSQILNEQSKKAIADNRAMEKKYRQLLKAKADIQKTSYAFEKMGMPLSDIKEAGILNDKINTVRKELIKIQKAASAADNNYILLSEGPLQLPSDKEMRIAELKNIRAKLNAGLRVLKSQRKQLFNKYGKNAEAIQNLLDKENKYTIEWKNYISSAKTPANALYLRKFKNLYVRALMDKKELHLSDYGLFKYLKQTYEMPFIFDSLQKVNGILEHTPMDKATVEKAYLNAFAHSDISATEIKKIADTSLARVDRLVKPENEGETLKNSVNLRKIYNSVYPYTGDPQLALQRANSIYDNLYTHLFNPQETALNPENNIVSKIYHDKKLGDLYDTIMHRQKESPALDLIEKPIVGTKRLALMASPFHYFSLIKSNIYDEKEVLNPSVLFKSMDEVDKIKSDYLNNHIFPMFKDLSDKGFNTRVNLDRTVTAIKFPHEGVIAKFISHLDRPLWDKLFATEKLTRLKDISDDYFAGRITAERASAEIGQTDDIFGGQTKINLYASPALKHLLRIVSFAPDWEYTLLRQLGFAVSGEDYKYVKYWSNILSYNLVMNNLLAQYAGRQNLLTPQNIHELNSNDAYSFYVKIGGGTYQINSLGYEKEMATTIIKPIEALQEGGINKMASSLAWESQGKMSYLLKTVFGLGRMADNKETAKQFLMNFAPLTAQFLQKGNSPLSDAAVSAVNSSGLTASNVPPTKLPELVMSKSEIPLAALKQVIDEFHTQHNVTNNPVGSSRASFFASYAYRYELPNVNKIKALYVDFYKAKAKKDFKREEQDQNEARKIGEQMDKDFTNRIKNSYIFKSENPTVYNFFDKYINPITIAHVEYFKVILPEYYRRDAYSQYKKGLK